MQGQALRWDKPCQLKSSCALIHPSFIKSITLGFCDVKEVLIYFVESLQFFNTAGLYFVELSGIALCTLGQNIRTSLSLTQYSLAATNYSFQKGQYA